MEANSFWSHFIPTFSSFGIFQCSFSYGTDRNAHIWHTRPPRLLYFDCRMCDVCLEWPQLSSGQPLRPMRNVLSCVLTQAVIRDILSCPTYRCTAGSTLVSVSTAQTQAVVVHELPSWTLTLLRTQVTCGMEGW